MINRIVKMTTMKVVTIIGRSNTQQFAVPTRTTLVKMLFDR